MNPRTPTRVAILGGGFGGLYAATYLGSADVPEDALDITLVSDRNYFTFTPLLAEIVGGTLGPPEVTTPYRVLARKRGFRFRQGTVEAVDASAGKAYTSGGTVTFDYAVVALGARPSYFGQSELRDSTLPFTSVEDAAAIRNRVLAAAELAESEPDPARKRDLLTFAIAGAGPAGVELASEIQHLLERVLPRYYRLGAVPLVMLLDGGDRILRGWDETLAGRGEDTLRERGIDVRLSTRVEGFRDGVVHATGPSGDESFKAAALIWTAGTRPNPIGWVDAPPSSDASGRVRVEPTLAIPGTEHLFAVGDAAVLDDSRTGSRFPPVAPIAVSQGIRAAGNVENAIMGRPLEEYRGHHAGKIISLGNGIAFADVLGFQVRGRPAWLLYRTTYLLKLVGLKNKLRTGVSLTLNRAFGRDLGSL